MATFPALTTIADTAYSGATGNPPDLMAGALAETIVTRVKDEPTQRVLRLIDKAPEDLEDVHDEMSCMLVLC